MNYQLRLCSESLYIEDLKKIRDSIRVNGNESRCNSIIASHFNGAEIELFMNFALEQDSLKPPVVHSLSILGFKNKKNQPFVFNTKIPSEIEQNYDCKQLYLDGTYKSLGFTTKLPSISCSNLIESINILQQYNTDRSFGETECTALTRLIIATTEAIRFGSVAHGIQTILENDCEFVPNSFEIIGWGGHSIAS